MLAELYDENSLENVELTQLRGISLATFQAFESDMADKYHKLEYINGVVYAMAGGSRIHNRLEARIGGMFDRHLPEGPCGSYSANEKIVKDLDRTAEKHVKGVSVYPDASVQCEDADGNLMPLIIVEILSDSTGKKDRSQKLVAYKLLPSVREILFIDQYRMLVELFVRSGDVFTHALYKQGESFVLSSIALEISVDELYRGILKDE